MAAWRTTGCPMPLAADDGFTGADEGAAEAGPTGPAGVVGGAEMGAAARMSDPYTGSGPAGADGGTAGAAGLAVTPGPATYPAGGSTGAAGTGGAASTTSGGTCAGAGGVSNIGAGDEIVGTAGGGVNGDALCGDGDPNADNPLSPAGNPGAACVGRLTGLLGPVGSPAPTDGVDGKPPPATDGVDGTFAPGVEGTPGAGVLGTAVAVPAPAGGVCPGSAVG